MWVSQGGNYLISDITECEKFPEGIEIVFAIITCSRVRKKGKMFAFLGGMIIPFPK